MGRARSLVIHDHSASISPAKPRALRLASKWRLIHSPVLLLAHENFNNNTHKNAFTMSSTRPNIEKKVAFLVAYGFSTVRVVMWYNVQTPSWHNIAMSLPHGQQEGHLTAFSLDVKN